MTNNKNQILIRLNEDEHLQIQRNAKLCNKTVSAYLRELALNMTIFNVDTSCITKHISQITTLSNAIAQLIFTIKKTDNYTPADLEYIDNKIGKILECEKEFLNIYINSIESEKKLIEKTIQNIVNKE